jgi:antitoxin component YwqK of YwqJK toxin-antitoxin module
MKRILAPIVLLTFLFPSLAYGVTWDELVVRDGLYYEKFSDVPFTGKITGKTQGTFRNGKEHGPFITFWDNGQLWRKGNFKNGEQDGPWTHYFENGVLASKGTFKNGEWNGFWVVYTDIGTLNREETGTYKNHVKVPD